MLCLLYDSYFGKIKISGLMQFQPRKQKKKENKDFDNNFQFVNDISDYNKDTWNDLNKYIKRKAKTKLDDKIKRIRRGSESKIQVHIYNFDVISLQIFSCFNYIYNNYVTFIYSSFRMKQITNPIQTYLKLKKKMMNYLYQKTSLEKVTIFFTL